MSERLAPGFGATLAAAREARGLSVAEAAERLKLSPRQVQALEAEDWGQLPDPVFVRGFVRNYARLVGLDPQTLLPAVDGNATVTQTITAPSAGVRLGGSPVARWLLLPLLLVALFVAVVAGLYTWLRQGEQAIVPMPPVSGLTTSEAGKALPSPPLEPAVMAPVTEPSPAQANSPPPPARLDPMPRPAPEAAAPATPAPGDETPAREGASPARVSMRFQPAEDAWIQVVDAKGMRFSKLVRAGATEEVSGTPPFRLVVGNAANVNLIYNGHVIDLKPYIGEKVARLTLE